MTLLAVVAMTLWTGKATITSVTKDWHDRPCFEYKQHKGFDITVPYDEASVVNQFGVQLPKRLLRPELEVWVSETEDRTVFTIRTDPDFPFNAAFEEMMSDWGALPSPEITEWIGRLAADKWIDRFNASNEIRKMGQKAAPIVVRGLRSTDPEVRLRCWNLGKDLQLIGVGE